MKQFFLAVTVITAEPLVNDDAVLEPSVYNEVMHAVSRAPTNTAATVRGVPVLPMPTNGLSRTRLAIALVSAQRADGRWISGTNDVTGTAVEILKELSR